MPETLPLNVAYYPKGGRALTPTPIGAYTYEARLQALEDEVFED